MDKNKVAVALFNKLAEGYQEKYMDVNLYAETLDFFCDAIEKKYPEILEIACGPGNITKYLLNRRPDFKILGTDLSENMLSLARKNNPSALFQLMDCRDLGSVEKKYDGLMCGFVMPYLSKEESLALIAAVSKILKANGLFYISTIEDNYSNSTFKKGSTGEEIFMHYHEAAYLTESLESNGFIIRKIDRKEYVIADGTHTTDLILIAEKKT